MIKDATAHLATWCPRSSSNLQPLLVLLIIRCTVSIVSNFCVLVDTAFYSDKIQDRLIFFDISSSFYLQLLEQFQIYIWTKEQKLWSCLCFMTQFCNNKFQLEYCLPLWLLQLNSGPATNCQPCSIFPALPTTYLAVR